MRKLICNDTSAGYPPQQRDANVKGLPLQAVLLDKEKTPKLCLKFMILSIELASIGLCQP